MNQETKILAGIGLATLAIIVGGIFLLGKNKNTESPKPVDQKVLGIEDAQKVTADGAKVTIVEFSDFQCPACGQAQPTVKRIMEEYQGKINFVYKHFPIPGHKNAYIAAYAAEAAGEQGKFWEMGDKLFETQDEWSKVDKPLDIFVGFAKDLELDEAKFKTDVESAKYKDRVDKGFADGTAAGVSATPTFFVNGYKFVGALSYQQFKTEIDKFITN